MASKNRKTINVSLQSKKYCGPMNDLIQKWEDDGTNLSVQICENLLLLDKLQKSATMLKVLNMYELTSKTLNLYEIKDEKKIEEIMSKVIRLDVTGLNEIFLTINQFPETQVQKSENIEPLESKISPTFENKIQNIQKNEESINQKIETKIEEVPKVEEVPIPSQEDYDIPMDFLING